MSKRIPELAQQLFNNHTLDECSIQDIIDLTTQFPFFAPGQFLLLEKLRKGNDARYEMQLQKAFLYYADPLEFEFLVHEDNFHTDVQFDELEKEPVALQQEEPLSVISEAPAAITETETETDEIQVVETPEIVSTPILPATGTLTFEPYHTVDYFASQGIKLSQEDKPRDKFGRQLKSFTEWLRTMKRLPAPETVQNMDPGSEKDVQNLAEHSVNEADVVTEAMAEVWEKQGNRQKAIEVYNKLSLYNPSKKAYFAAKIENLKGI